MHQPRKVRKCVMQTQPRLDLGGRIFFSALFSFWGSFFCLRQRRRCCDVSACVEETKNKQRKYGDQPHRQAREEGNGQKGWNYNFGKNRSRTKRPPAKNGRFWAGAGRAVGWAGWACWRFMKRWKFEKSSFFILGTKGLGREGQSALFPPPVITQTVGGTNIKKGFLVRCVVTLELWPPQLKLNRCSHH